jgi:hypothetical protein
MKRGLTWIGLGFSLFIAFLSIASTTHARSCRLSGMAGTYGYTTFGTIPSLGAVAAVGHITLDASGNLAGAQTASFNGAIVQETLSGTYTVNADCTGTATVSVYHAGVLARTTNLEVVFENDQRDLRAIFLTAGTVLTVNGKKIFHDDED